MFREATIFGPMIVNCSKVTDWASARFFARVQRARQATVVGTPTQKSSKAAKTQAPQSFLFRVLTRE